MQRSQEKVVSTTGTPTWLSLLIIAYFVHVLLILMFLLLDYLCKSLHQFADHEGLTLHLIELAGHKSVDLGAQIGYQLSQVLFSHNHLFIFTQYFGGILLSIWKQPKYHFSNEHEFATSLR